MKQVKTIAVLGSHSALDVCRGAKDEGFSTLVVVEPGREKTYSHYFKTNGNTGCVDECLMVPKFKELMSSQNQKLLLDRETVFVPHRSFEVYLNYDYQAIEHDFTVPIFGNKHLLKIEERSGRMTQYTLLQEAGIRYPKAFPDYNAIDRLCLVKLTERARPWERAFFLAASPQEFCSRSAALLKNGTITQDALDKAVIEEYIVGAQVNFNFFYSPLNQQLELLGTDTRRQTNLDGLIRVPYPQQSDLSKYVSVSYEEAGHIAVTVLESLLEKAYTLGEAFVAATQRLVAPGIIGPFSLQSIITAGPPAKDLVVVDVSPRMPGSPGITATPYSTYLYANPMSAGRRVAREIRKAIQLHRLSDVVS